MFDIAAPWWELILRSIVEEVLLAMLENNGSISGSQGLATPNCTGRTVRASPSLQIESA